MFGTLPTDQKLAGKKFERRPASPRVQNCHVNRVILQPEDGRLLQGSARDKG